MCSEERLIFVAISDICEMPLVQPTGQASTSQVLASATVMQVVQSTGLVDQSFTGRKMMPLTATGATAHAQDITSDGKHYREHSSHLEGLEDEGE